MSDNEVNVGNFSKSAQRSPRPIAKVPVDAGPDDGVAELNVKMDEVVKQLQAIDWKLWVYLKSNNYID